MFKFIMIDLAIFLTIKMNHIICNVVKFFFHNNVWAKSFWKELFQSPLIMVVVIHHDKLTYWNFHGFTFLLKYFFWLAWDSSITCHVCNWLSSNCTNSKKNLFCNSSIPNQWFFAMWNVITSFSMGNVDSTPYVRRKGVKPMDDLNVELYTHIAWCIWLS